MNLHYNLRSTLEPFWFISISASQWNISMYFEREKKRLFGNVLAWMSANRKSVNYLLVGKCCISNTFVFRQANCFNKSSKSHLLPCNFSNFGFDWHAPPFFMQCRSSFTSYRRQFVLRYMTTEMFCLWIGCIESIFLINGGMKNILHSVSIATKSRKGKNELIDPLFGLFCFFFVELLVKVNHYPLYVGQEHKHSDTD